ncbi:MAG TPA: cation-translocating P-type ATPase [Candidatus Pacearchaeota archaeon]|nr:cation-translocating P-type ATPase [Candidatus Pacearchaeota archaeon]HOH04462.1 cation-translocating P-type ATPase [Candidatus Pacearchaeota archaeon]HPX74877.1 cation-translocating P-type ATPase [Candidatus Pacearchaeota archaeon]HQC61378.1 cation-translocating P-type ATPase [Candidatus Pacearchaeota archaeon]
MQSITESLQSMNLTGLTEREASSRLQKNGYNELPREKRKTTFKIVLEVLKEPMFLLLIFCWIIYLILGDIKESFLLLGFVVVIIFITIYQENKTEKALDALRNLSSPRALVIRGGQRKRIPGREVVQGDIIVLSEGDRVPADAIVVTSTNFFVDESILTGESVAAKKKPTKNFKILMQKPGGENTPFIYSGTLVVRGTAIAIVKSTGIETEMGKIGKSLEVIKTEKTNLQKETNSLVKYFAIYGISACVLVIIAYGILKGNWIEAMLSGVTLAMSVLPEEFPVVLTLFLGLGAWRMSKKNVLIRRQQAISELGSTTVLCTDKTGTLTQNKMAVTKLYWNNQTCFIENNKKIPEQFHEVVEYGILASQKEPFDPMEKALKELSRGNESKFIHKTWHLLQEYPLSDKLMAISHVWSKRGKSENIVAAKGAPEAIIELCRMDFNNKKRILKEVASFSKEGLRVIAVAKSSSIGPLPKDQHDFDFEFVGLIGFEDPIRPTVPQAIKECYDAGIRVIMITGDYHGTAQNIALEIGLKNPDKYITGDELENLSDSQLKKKIKDVNIFVRVVPQQKLRLVNALKSNGEIVAMTGDGVNDAPALKSANIGVSMGERGTDVAREASSIVLLDDNFTSIVNGVKMGRRVFDNIRKAMSYVFSMHIPILGITVLALIFGWPLILLPVHILFMELIIDPTCSIVFEAEKAEENIMKRKPRNPKEKIFNKRTLNHSIFQGLGMLLSMAALFYFTFKSTNNEYLARAMAFSNLIFSSLLLILSSRSISKPFYKTILEKNKAFWFVAIGALFFLALSLYTPFFNEVFRFSTLTIKELGISFGVALLGMLWFEIVKHTHYLHYDKKRFIPK